MFAPALLPAPIVERLDAAVQASLAHPGCVSRLKAPSLQPFPAGSVEFAAFQRVEVVKWGQVVCAANITAD